MTAAVRVQGRAARNPDHPTVGQAPDRGAGGKVFLVHGAVSPLSIDVLVIAAAHIDHCLALRKTHLPGIGQGRFHKGVQYSHDAHLGVKGIFRKGALMRGVLLFG